jgi:hypothetical protein
VRFLAASDVTFLLFSNFRPWCNMRVRAAFYKESLDAARDFSAEKTKSQLAGIIAGYDSQIRSTVFSCG